ncbi:MAG: hydroxyectoine utilization dehydratase EutB [Gammaproteobacteria bacterium]
MRDNDKVAGVSVEDIRRARSALDGLVTRTPLIPSQSLSQRTGSEVSLKLETLQATGAFKLRGATNRLVNLSSAARRRGVACCSTGNHGRGLAYAARQLGVSATICMSKLVPTNKVAAIEALGATVVITGDSQDEAQLEVERLVEEKGVIDVSPFDDPHIIAGQGTIGLELLEDLPDADTVLVPLSGGGLISGIALALKAASAHIRVIGVSMERGAAMYESQRAGRPVAVTEEATLADCLGGGIGIENRHTFEMVRALVDDFVLLTEDEIAAGMRHALLGERLVVEGGGAVGMAAVLADKVQTLGQKVAIVVSGNNVDMQKLLRICAEEK